MVDIPVITALRSQRKEDLKLKAKSALQHYIKFFRLALARQLGRLSWGSQFASFHSRVKSSKQDSYSTIFLHLLLLEAWYSQVLFSFSYKHGPILWSPDHQWYWGSSWLGRKGMTQNRVGGGRQKRKYVHDKEGYNGTTESVTISFNNSEECQKQANLLHHQYIWVNG